MRKSGWLGSLEQLRGIFHHPKRRSWTVTASQTLGRGRFSGNGSFFFKSRPRPTFWRQSVTPQTSLAVVRVNFLQTSGKGKSSNLNAFFTTKIAIHFLAVNCHLGRGRQSQAIVIQHRDQQQNSGVSKKTAGEARRANPPCLKPVGVVQTDIHFSLG